MGEPLRPSKVSIADWSPSEKATACASLAAMGAVFFGHASSVPSNRARAWLGDLMSSKCVLHVPCDAGPEESAACQRAGITHLPAVVAGGQVAPGAYVPDVVDLINNTIPVARALREQGAVLYGRDSCVWTRRQHAVLGLAGRAAVPYVDCADGGEGEKRCGEAGVDTVPTWVLRGVRLPGYRPVPALKALLEKDKPALEAQVREEAKQQGR